MPYFFSSSFFFFFSLPFFLLLLFFLFLPFSSFVLFFFYLLFPWLPPHLSPPSSSCASPLAFAFPTTLQRIVRRRISIAAQLAQACEISPRRTTQPSRPDQCTQHSIRAALSMCDRRAQQQPSAQQHVFPLRTGAAVGTPSSHHHATSELQPSSPCTHSARTTKDIAQTARFSSSQTHLSNPNVQPGLHHAPLP